jgi:hypothetical protein
MMLKWILIPLGVLIGFFYLCSLAFYLSYTGLVKEVPTLMSFLIYSVEPLSVLALPLVAFCAGLILFSTIVNIRKKEKILTSRYYLLLSYLVLSIGFFIFIIGMNNWKLIPVLL